MSKVVVEIDTKQHAVACYSCRRFVACKLVTERVDGRYVQTYLCHECGFKERSEP